MSPSISSGGTEVKEKASIGGTHSCQYKVAGKAVIVLHPLSEGGCRKSRVGCGLELQLPGAGFSHSFAQKLSEESVKCCL